MVKIKHFILSTLLLVLCCSAGASVKVLTGADAKEYKSRNAASLKTEGMAVTRAGNIWLSLAHTRPESKFSAVSLSCRPASGGWEESFVVLSCDSRSVSNSILWADPMGNLRIFYSLTPENGEEQELYCMICADPDGSASLMTPVKIGSGYASGIPAIQPGGIIALPAMEQNVGPVVYLSSNNGLSWERCDGPRDTPELQKAASNDPEFYVADPGELSMVLRSCGTAWSYRSVSNDSGRTWSTPQPFIYNPHAALSVSSLGGGKALVVKSNRYDIKKFHLQRGLYAYITPNNGEGWYGGLQIDSREYTGSPVCAVSKGKIHIAYTRKDKGLNEILYAETTESEIDEAWGTLTTPPAVRNVIFSAGKSQEVFEKRLSALNKGGHWTDRTVRVCTYNVMFHKFSKDPNWSERRPSIKKIFDDYAFDAVGMQEPDTMMVRTMLEDLEGKYACAMTIRKAIVDDEEIVLPLNPIFYNKERLEVVDDGVIDFADAPGTRGYDSWTASRNCNWVKFRDKVTDKLFFLFNSHVDHRGLEAKECSPLKLLEEAEKITGGLPAFFTGDFNFDEQTPGYANMVNSGWTEDSMLALPEKKRINWEYFSMSRFKPISTVKKSYRHLDHVFYTPANSSIQHWQLITDSHNGVFGSDHLPVFVDAKIAN